MEELPYPHELINMFFRCLTGILCQRRLVRCRFCCNIDRIVGLVGPDLDIIEEIPKETLIWLEQLCYNLYQKCTNLKKNTLQNRIKFSPNLCADYVFICESNKRLVNALRVFFLTPYQIQSGISRKST
eukprot:UN23984